MRHAALALLLACSAGCNAITGIGEHEFCDDCGDAADTSIADASTDSTATNDTMGGDESTDACATITCEAGRTCSAGACVCPTGWQVCGAICVDPLTNHDNCGGCGKPCGTRAICSAGACACASGSGLSVCYNQCYDTATDPQFCGAGCVNCTTSCASATCEGGTCKCP